MVRHVRIGDRPIGGGAPCFIIAEAGVNHDGDRQRAHDLVAAAAAAGADAVKFQTWQTDKLIRPGARMADYQSRNSPADEDQYAMLCRLELPYAWHAELKTHAESLGLIFLSTPDEIDSARFLVTLGVPALKVGSAELTNHPYLKQLARLGKPLLLSTGMSDMAEVEAAVQAVRTAGDVPLALLHCVSCYPAPDEEQNLRCLPAMAQAFGVPIGFSDHTTQAQAPVVALALGMAIYERHLTLDRQLPGPDHAASTEPGAFSELVRSIRSAEILLGDGRKRCMPSEAGTRTAVARSLHYTKALPVGHRLTADDLIALRPEDGGLPPTVAETLLGRPLRRAVAAGEQIRRADLP